jgi:hypothetical protein
MELTMVCDLAQQISSQDHVYRLQFKGALNSRIIDMCGDITIIKQECGGILTVSLMVDPAALSSFLAQFENFNLTLLPIDNEIQNCDPQNNGSLDISQWITTGISMPEEPLVDSK